MLKLKKGEFTLHHRILYVAPADSWHQPEELPDGTVWWHKKRRRQGSEDSLSGYEEDDVFGAAALPPEQEDVNANKDEAKEEAEEEEEEVVLGECKINVLNDDCLIHIFSFLNKRERIRIERGMV